jgi:hypothetical protein
MNDVVGRYSRPGVQPPRHTGSEVGFVEEGAAASAGFVFLEIREQLHDHGRPKGIHVG